MLRKVLTGLGAVLVLFHVWLFAGQAWDGNLFEAGRLARWLVAAGLAVAFVVGARRRGRAAVPSGASLKLTSLRSRFDARSVPFACDSIFRGRKGVAVWLLAATLHGPAIAQRLDDGGSWTLQQVVATLTQISFASAGCLLALAAWRIARRLGVPRARAFPLARRRMRTCAPGPHNFLFAAPRPPPLG